MLFPLKSNLHKCNFYFFHYIKKNKAYNDKFYLAIKAIIRLTESIGTSQAKQFFLKLNEVNNELISENQLYLDVHEMNLLIAGWIKKRSVPLCIEQLIFKFYFVKNYHEIIYIISSAMFRFYKDFRLNVPNAFILEKYYNYFNNILIKQDNEMTVQLVIAILEYFNDDINLIRKKYEYGIIHNIIKSIHNKNSLCGWRYLMKVSFKLDDKTKLDIINNNEILSIFAIGLNNQSRYVNYMSVSTLRNFIGIGHIYLDVKQWKHMLETYNIEFNVKELLLKLIKTDNKPIFCTFTGYAIFESVKILTYFVDYDNKN